MLQPEQTANLNRLFAARYSKLFAELNKNVYVAARQDDGSYESPGITLGAGGFTATLGNKQTDLNNPAVAAVTMTSHKEQQVTYRIAIPSTELVIAANKPEYFNHLMDSILRVALARFKEACGSDENVLRFGKCFCSYQRPDGSIFTDLSDDLVEIQLHGSWASNEVA